MEPRLDRSDGHKLPLLIADDFPPQFGGIQRYMRCLADAFHSLGRPIVVLAPHTDGAENYDAGLPYRVVRYRGRSRAEKLARITAACFDARRRVEDYTLAALWFPSGLAVSILPAEVRGRLGVLVHGSDVTKPRGVRREIMRRVISGADAVIANSQFTKQLVVQAGLDREVQVSACGVDDFPVSSARAARPTILAVGRLIRRKGFDRLIDAMPAVLLKRPDVLCEIVGDGPERNALGRRAEELGIERNICFLGAVDDSEVQAAYGRAWCFALPVRRDGNDVEGFGIVYLEAAIAALPAIGGLDSGAPDAIVHGETGYIVDGANVAEISRTLLAILENRDAADEMGRRARLRALRDFSWQAGARRIDAFMKPDPG